MIMPPAGVKVLHESQRHMTWELTRDEVVRVVHIESTPNGFAVELAECDVHSPYHVINESEGLCQRTLLSWVRDCKRKYALPVPG